LGTSPEFSVLKLHYSNTRVLTWSKESVISEPEASARELLARHRNATTQSLTDVSGWENGNRTTSKVLSRDCLSLVLHYRRNCRKNLHLAAFAGLPVKDAVAIGAVSDSGPS